MVSVSDQNRPPVADVPIEISDIPNSVGSTYRVIQRTAVNGIVAIDGIPAGNRGVTMTVPPGFVAGTTGATRRVDVVKGVSVAVEFALIRQ